MGKKAFSTKLAEEHGLARDRYPTTDEELRTATETLALDLNKMSIDEQEKMLFDIHGLPSADDPCSLDRLQKLKAL